MTEIRYVAAEAEQLVTCPRFCASFARVVKGQQCDRHFSIPYTIVRYSKIQNPRPPHKLGSVDRQMVLL